MSERCERCDCTIADDDLAYRLKRPREGETVTFCSVNCVADTDEFDEHAVRDRLEAAVTRRA